MPVNLCLLSSQYIFTLLFCTMETTPKEIMKDKKFLLVDISPACNYLASQQLKQLWANEENIVMVQDWIEAVAIAKKEAFDVIITDTYKLWIDMKDAAREIREHYQWKGPKIIAHTSVTDDMKDASSFDAMALKIVSQQQLEHNIFKVLNMTRPQM